VNAFYVLLTELDTQLKNVQLLVCDNRPPAGADSMVIVRFTGDETKGRVGLVGKEPEPENQPADELAPTEAQSDSEKSGNSGAQTDPPEKTD
jgi:hypothetical protein